MSPQRAHSYYPVFLSWQALIASVIYGVICLKTEPTESVCRQRAGLRNFYGSVSLSLSLSFVTLLVAFRFRTAISNALGWPMMTTSLFPLVTAV